MSRSVRADGVGGAAMKCAQSNAERAGDDAQRFDDAEDAGCGDGAHADVAHVARIDLRGGHRGDGHHAGIDGRVHMAADKPDERDENEVREYAAGTEDDGAAQAHHVAQAEDEADGVEVEDHAAAVGKRAHDRNELQVDGLAPDVKRGDKEVVEAGDAGGLQQQLGLRAAAFAGDQHLGDGRGLRERELAVHLAHEEASQRNDEEHAQAAAGETDENGLEGIGTEVKDVERRKREYRACHHRGRCAARAGEDDVFKQTRAALVHARQADGEDGDRDRCFHPLPHLERRIGRSDREDDAEKNAPQNGARRQLRRVHGGLDNWRVNFAGFERAIGVFRKRCGFWLAHCMSPLQQRTFFAPRWLRRAPRNGIEAPPFHHLEPGQASASAVNDAAHVLLTR